MYEVFPSNFIAMSEGARDIALNDNKSHKILLSEKAPNCLNHLVSFNDTKTKSASFRFTFVFLYRGSLSCVIKLPLSVAVK